MEGGGADGDLICDLSYPPSERSSLADAVRSLVYQYGRSATFIVQGLPKKWTLGCENYAGKLGHKW